MGLGEAMIIGGIGCRKGASAAAITAAVEAACVQAGLAASRVDALATAAIKETEPGIAEAAAALGVPLILVSEPDLRAAGDRAATHSARVMELMGVPSVAEAAALAAGGPAAILFAARIAVGPVTCALAETERVP
jgi:cobalt-precorrin 5A hydrolase